MVAFNAPQPIRKKRNTITVTAPKGATKVKVAAKFAEPGDGKDKPVVKRAGQK